MYIFFRIQNSPYSKREQQYVDVGADPDTAKLAAQCYPDAKSKQDIYNKYKSQGYNATDAKKLANYEIIHGENNAKNYAANNVKKSGTDYTATSSRENPNTDWRTLNRLNAGAGETSYGKSIENTEFFKENGGLDASDYISIHSRKHMYDPDTVSTPKKLNMERMLMLENCVKILL